MMCMTSDEYPNKDHLEAKFAINEEITTAHRTNSQRSLDATHSFEPRAPSDAGADQDDDNDKCTVTGTELVFLKRKIDEAADRGCGTG